MCDMIGRIFSIQPFCVDDGPGLRTCVYLKGCDMRCAWCHNPESISPLPETSYMEARCAGCGRCAQVCPAHSFENGKHRFDRAKCDCGGEDTKVCPTGALTRVGSDRTAEDVVREVARDRRYFDRSSGGITLTGGEPMTQPGFVRALLTLAKASGIHTCVETNGAGRYKDYEGILGCTDLFLVDYKLTDDEKHIEMTGRSNRGVIQNIEALCEAGAKVAIRCPIIPGVNDTDDHLRAIAEMTKRLNVLGFELMPYHPFGVSKSERLGKARQTQFTVPEMQIVEGCRAAILSMGGREWRRSI